MLVSATSPALPNNGNVQKITVSLWSSDGAAKGGGIYSLGKLHGWSYLEITFIPSNG
jgi:hypothetical protein